LKKNLLTYKNHFVPYISADHNCLIINVIHFVIEGVVEDDFFVVAGQFSYSCTDRRGYNLVIIAVGEVKSAIIVVVRDIVVDHNYGFPGVEDRVGDDGSKGRAAYDVVAIDVAAIDAVVEVVGHSVVVNRSDVMRDVDVVVVVVVIRVYVGRVRGVTGARTVIRTMTVIVGVSSRGGLGRVGGDSIAGCTYRLRLCHALLCITSFGGGSCIARLI
jgi:hypothetical protein